MNCVSNYFALLPHIEYFKNDLSLWFLGNHCGLLRYDANLEYCECGF